MSAQYQFILIIRDLKIGMYIYEKIRQKVKCDSISVMSANTRIGIMYTNQ